MKSKPLLIGFFIFVALFAAVSLYFTAVIGRPTRTISALPSPGGKYKAVTLTMSHAGLMPYCFDSVSVILAVYPDDFGERNKLYEVFADACAKFADGTPSPAIQWASPDTLRITFAKSPTGIDAAKRVRKDHDATRDVHVTFVERD